jgi:hypothetical protein
MSTRRWVGHVILISVAMALMMFANGCAEEHAEGSFNSILLGVCDGPRQDSYANTYYKFVRDDLACLSCHETGPGSGLFANKDISVAYSAFLTKGEEKIATFATASHKPPYTGTQHQSVITKLRQDWAVVEDDFKACVKRNGTNSGGNNGGALPQPDEFTMANDYTLANATQSIVMSWDLGSEMASGAEAVPGVTFEMTLSASDLGGGNGAVLYQLGNPRIVNNGTQPILIAGIGVRINGASVFGGTTFYNLQRYVPSVANNNTRRLSNGGAITFAGTINTLLSVQIGFADIGPAGFDFQPQTFAQLNAAGGVFQANCVSCHGTSGGYPINTYARVVGGVGNSGLTLVTKYSLVNSHIWTRINSSASPMPPTGLMPATPNRDRVRDWILDGAPNVAGDILR